MSRTKLMFVFAIVPLSKIIEHVAVRKKPTKPFARNENNADIMMQRQAI